MRSFERDGLRFDVHDGGTARRGTVLALHGFPQTGAMWQPLRPALHEAGYRVVAPDQRGYSPGARPPGTRPYAQPELLADVVGLLEALDVGPVHVVGHDWGGALAWTLAARRPELVRSLTVLSTPHPRALQHSLLGTQVLHSWYVGAFQTPWVPERLLLAHDAAVLTRTLRGSGLSRAGVAASVALLQQPGAATAALNWYRGLRHGGPVAGAVDVPTQYVWGDADAFLGRQAAETTRGYVTGPYRFVPVAGGSHWLVEQRPDEVAGLLLEHLAATSD